MRSPRPLWGALLGATVGLMGVLLSWQLAIAPPDRLLLWGAVSLAALAGSYATSHARPPSRRAFGAVAVCAGVGMVVALTGIPELARGGSLTGPCVVNVGTDNNALPQGDPELTAATSPWYPPLDAPVDWEYAVAALQPVTASATGLTVGGFDAVLMREVVPTGVAPADNGTVHVGDLITQWRAEVGYYPHGIHHVFVTVTAGSDQCVMRGYVAVPPAHPFDGTVLVALWVLTVGSTMWLGCESVRFGRSRTRPPSSDSLT